MPVKKIPMRQCAACREHRPKKELLRVVRQPDGTVSLDTKGKVSGRGAYICPDKACFAKARKSRALERHLEVTLTPEIYDALEAAVNGP